MQSKQQSIDVIGELIERFDYHIKEYKAGIYNETQTRNDFINPFFEALGWDINNRAGLAESYREVIHEDRLKVGLSTKAPDYCFTVYGQRKFFVEAKKPSVDIKEAIDPAYQLRRYGWSAKMPISIITDFEELSIYDCTVKPAPTDRASVSRIKYLNFKDYLSEIDFLWDTFSKEQVLKGSFDKYISSNKGKKGTTGVDAEFLKSLDSWRDILARNIVNRNNSIGEDELNYSLQKIIDRIIFLRICEDRGVELEGQLQKSLGSNVYENLKVLFHSADQKYNSGLFDYKKDTITDSLSIDDKTLKTIIEEMYYPKSPYEFSVIPVEILGHSYEQYLGKVIRITPGHRIKIEEKPEVRKAGGVYYTPQYIVDYIVKNTVGKLIEDKTPDDVSKIKICDPACGSGSFLLGAYQFLLDWHRSYYQNDESKKKDKVLTPDGNLTTSIKKQILINNIFGVDIDTNAVEVTKLSLMLKAMEGETEASINNQLSLLLERILPTLDNNIKSGNSLIDIDFFDNQLDFEPNIEKKVKPFNWQSAFPEVFKQGGFDAVIGNPPYGAVYSDNVKSYLSTKFDLPIPIADTYLMFIKNSINISKLYALLSFIVPTSWLYMTQYIIFRKYFLNNSRINELLLFRKSVFMNVTVETCIVNFDNQIPNKHSEYNYKEVFDEPSKFMAIENKAFQIDVINKQDMNLILTDSFTENIFTNLRNNNPQLKELALIVCGLTPYRLGKGKPPQTESIVKQRLFDSDFKKDDSYRQYLMGRDFVKYSFQIQKERWLSYGDWLAEPRYKAPFNDAQKIIVRQTSDSIIAHLDTNKFISLKNVHNIRITDPNITYEYLLGVLNSSLIDWWYKKLIPEKGRVFAEVKVVNLEKLPIRIIDFESEVEKQINNNLISSVQTMLRLNKDLQYATLPEQKEQLKARIEYTDKKIDRLVYQLYDLTEDEIKIVEGE